MVLIMRYIYIIAIQLDSHGHYVIIRLPSEIHNYSYVMM